MNDKPLDDASFHTAGMVRLLDQYTAAMASMTRPDFDRAIAALDEILSRCAAARELLKKMKDGG